MESTVLRLVSLETLTEKSLASEQLRAACGAGVEDGEVGD